jgi:hypothetical protein
MLGAIRVVSSGRSEEPLGMGWAETECLQDLPGDLRRMDVGEPEGPQALRAEENEQLVRRAPPSSMNVRSDTMSRSGRAPVQSRGLVGPRLRGVKSMPAGASEAERLQALR